MANEIFYDCRWTSQVDDKFIEDFIKVSDSVFKNNFSREFFDKKYTNNIYGESVVVVVYIDGVPSAARALWRNDVDGKEAYQPGGTCVLEACRGKGVFTEMTKRSTALLPKDALIYNFPNDNSFPGYIKMGWRLIKEYGFSIFTKKRFFKEHPTKMDEAYAKWWLPSTKGLLYFKRGKDYFIVKKMSTPFCFRLVACVDEHIAKQFPKKSPGVVFYMSEEKHFYNVNRGAPIRVVTKAEDVNYIPAWKIDSL